MSALLTGYCFAMTCSVQVGVGGVSGRKMQPEFGEGEWAEFVGDAINVIGSGGESGQARCVDAVALCCLCRVDKDLGRSARSPFAATPKSWSARLATAPLSHRQMRATATRSQRRVGLPQDRRSGPVELFWQPGTVRRGRTSNLM